VFSNCGGKKDEGWESGTRSQKCPRKRGVCCRHAGRGKEFWLIGEVRGKAGHFSFPLSRKKKGEHNKRLDHPNRPDTKITERGGGTTIPSWPPTSPKAY